MLDSLRSMGAKWGLAILYLALCCSLVLLIPVWVRPVFVAVYLLYALWTYLTLESDYGRGVEIRPLTRWDMPQAEGFREQLSRAAEAAGLRREPIWAVQYDEVANASALGGRRGLVIFTTQLLRQFPPDEVLAVVGHELNHLASRDSLPPMLGGAMLNLVGRLSGLCQQAAGMTRSRRTPFASVLLVISLVLDLCLLVVGWVARIFLAKRSRFQEHQADLAGARLTSAGTMISALERLDELAKGGSRPAAAKWSAAWIAQELYASHPPTEQRVAFLRRALERGDLRA